jgi:hypothetical protein
MSTTNSSTTSSTKVKYARRGFPVWFSVDVAAKIRLQYLQLAATNLLGLPPTSQSGLVRRAIESYVTQMEKLVLTGTPAQIELEALRITSCVKGNTGFFEVNPSDMDPPQTLAAIKKSKGGPVKLSAELKKEMAAWKRQEREDAAA